MSDFSKLSSNLLTNILAIPIGFISSVFIARYLGVEGRGLFSYAVLISGFFLPIISIGIDAGFVYYISNKKYLYKNLFGSIFFSVIIISSIYIFLINFFHVYDILPWKLTKDFDDIEMLVISFLILCNCFFLFYNKTLNANNEFHLPNYLNIAYKIIAPFFTIVFCVLSSDKVGGALFGLLFGTGILVLFQFFKIRNWLDINLNIDKLFLKQSLDYGFKGWVGNIAVIANNRIDQFTLNTPLSCTITVIPVTGLFDDGRFMILGAMFAPSYLGIYGISVLLSELIWVPVMSLNPILHNRIAKNFIESKSEVLLEFEFISRVSFVFSICLTILFIPFAYIAIHYIYGKAYGDAFIPFLILLPGTVFSIITKFLVKLFSASGDIMITSKIQMFIMATGLILYSLLIKKFEIEGVAFATSLSYFLGAILSLYYFRKLYSRNIQDLLIIKSNDLKILKLKLLDLKHRYC